MKNQLLSFAAAATMLLYSTTIFISCSSHRNENEKFEQEEEEGEEENERGAGADKQLSSWFQAKAYPNPANLTQKYMAGWEQEQELKNNSPFGNAANRTETIGNWTAFGPKVFGGRVLSLA